MLNNIRTKQAIIVAAVLLLVVFLFTRDIKGLVKPKEQTSAAPANSELTNANTTQIDLGQVSTAGKNTINANLAAEITSLENAYKVAKDGEQLKVAETLAQKWDDVEQTVPSALYLEIIAKQQNTLESWLTAGGKFMKAYDNNSD
ncbi:MAG: repeat-containing protein, partial [Pedobacter sp.]|nr:repeat-containing protein [Pedobacter sp.]